MEEQKKLNILIIRNDHIGDLVNSTQIFRELKKFYPNSKVTVVASPLNSQLIIKNKYIDEFLILNMAEYTYKSIKEYYKMYKEVRKRKFDVGIDMRGSIMNSFFLLWLVGIKKRSSRIDNHRFIKYFVNIPIDMPYKTHVLNDNLTMINRTFNINSVNTTREIYTDKSDDERIENFMGDNKLKDKEFISLHIFTGYEPKQWPLQNWEKLIKYLEKFDKKVLIFGTKDDEDKLNNLKKLNKNSVLALNMNLREMYLLLKKSKFFICQDGGPMHIAGVADVKHIVLFNPFIFGMPKVIPLKNAVILNATKFDMSTISFEDVKKAVDGEMS